MYSGEKTLHDTKVRVELEVKVYSSRKKSDFFPPFPFVIFPFNAPRWGSSRLFAPLFRALASTFLDVMPSTRRIFEDPRREKTLSRIKPQVFIAAVFKNHALNAKCAPSGLQNVLYRENSESEKKSREN